MRSRRIPDATAVLQRAFVHGETADGKRSGRKGRAPHGPSRLLLFTLTARALCRPIRRGSVLVGVLLRGRSVRARGALGGGGVARRRAASAARCLVAIAPARARPLLPLSGATTRPRRVGR